VGFLAAAFRRHEPPELVHGDGGRVVFLSPVHHGDHESVLLDTGLAFGAGLHCVALDAPQRVQHDIRVVVVDRVVVFALVGRLVPDQAFVQLARVVVGQHHLLAYLRRHADGFARVLVDEGESALLVERPRHLVVAQPQLARVRVVRAHDARAVPHISAHCDVVVAVRLAVEPHCPHRRAVMACAYTLADLATWLAEIAHFLCRERG
jgi:hypothetical protein